jgi:predicted permease
MKLSTRSKAAKKGETMDKYMVLGIPLGLLIIVFGFFAVLLIMLFFIKKTKREK